MPHSGIGSRIRNYFLTGLIVAGPVAITLWLVWSFVTWVDDLVRPFIPIAYRPETYLPIKVPGFGLIIAFVALTLLGFLTANLVGRTLVEVGETLLERMPIVRPLYRGLKQVFETLFSKSGSTFRKVALVEFPSPGMWSLVFLSTPPGSDITDAAASRRSTSRSSCRARPIRPPASSSTSPRRGIIELDIPVEAAAKLIMTAGMIQPGGNGGDEQRTLAALAHTARAAQAARATAPAK